MAMAESWASSHGCSWLCANSSSKEQQRSNRRYEPEPQAHETGEISESLQARMLIQMLDLRGQVACKKEESAPGLARQVRRGESQTRAGRGQPHRDRRECRRE